MSGFTIDWLDLREAADRSARDDTLRERTLQWLEAGRSIDQTPVVVDLGAGTGSTLRALTSADKKPFNWRLVDLDEVLLAEAQRRHGSAQQIETCAADLARLEALPLNGARLVTASALFDLVSDRFVDALASALQEQNQHSPVGLYAALNYDGTTEWTPKHPLDDLVLKAFNLDQRQDKGLGPALGPEAGKVARTAFTDAGFEVVSASSPWMLDGGDRRLVTALIEGIAGAVADSPGLDARALQDWVRFRKEKVGTGTCKVGHTDLLALPS